MALLFFQKTIFTSLYGLNSVGLDELQRAVDEINALYMQKNYVTARAILPPQTVNDGVVEILLVEGRVGQILVENSRYTRESYFLKRVSLRPGDLVRPERLEDDIIRFNLLNNSQISAELRAGSEFGATDVALKVDGPPINSGVVFVDNGGRYETGEYRVGLNVVRNSVFGWQDALSVGATFSTGSLGVSLSYGIPIGVKGAKLAFAFDHNMTHIIAGQLEPIDVDGVVRTLGLTASYPFVVKPDVKVSGSIGIRAKQSDHFFSGVNLVSTRLYTASLGASAQFSGEAQLWRLQGDLTAAYVEVPEPWNFITLSGSVMWQRLVWEQGLLTCKGALQWANAELLPSSEQFAIGGVSSVRGYRDGAHMGDKGYSLSAELSYPIFRWLRGVVFLDHGAAFPYKGNEEPIDSSDFLTSIGIGATVSLTDRMTGNVIVGVPIGPEAGSVRIYFTIQHTL